MKVEECDKKIPKHSQTYNFESIRRQNVLPRALHRMTCAMSRSFSTKQHKQIQLTLRCNTYTACEEAGVAYTYVDQRKKKLHLKLHENIQEHIFLHATGFFLLLSLTSLSSFVHWL